jgi:hypothetical protein
MTTYSVIHMPRGTPVGRSSREPEFSDIPYAGLFGDTVMARVVEEIIADPHSAYRPKDLEDLTDASSPSVRDALVTLTKFGLLKSAGGKHPVYTVDTSRKSFVALTLLAYATLDDKEGSDCMNTAVQHYCETVLLGCLGSQAVAATSRYRITDQRTSYSPVFAVANGNAYHYHTGVTTQE